MPGSTMKFGIAASNPNWGERETVTIRFVKMLNEKGVADIHERIRRDASIYRQFHEILGRSGFHERTLHIDLKTMTIADPDAIRETLLQGGLRFVSAGNPGKVLEVIDNLSYADKQLPRMLLIQAYAKFAQGRF